MLNGPPYRGQTRDVDLFQLVEAVAGVAVAGGHGEERDHHDDAEGRDDARRRRRRGSPTTREPPHRRPASATPLRRGPDRSGRRGCEGLARWPIAATRRRPTSVRRAHATLLIGVPPRRAARGGRARRRVNDRSPWWQRYQRHPDGVAPRSARVAGVPVVSSSWANSGPPWPRCDRPRGRGWCRRAAPRAAG